MFQARVTERISRLVTTKTVPYSCFLVILLTRRLGVVEGGGCQTDLMMLVVAGCMLGLCDSTHLHTKVMSKYIAVHSISFAVLVFAAKLCAANYWL